MARPVWSGTLSFGLLNIPVSLMSGERRTDLHFRMLDARDKSPIRYERVNAETGEEVPWKEIVKAFEFEKGEYVYMTDEDFQATTRRVELTHLDGAGGIGALERGQVEAGGIDGGSVWPT